LLYDKKVDHLGTKVSQSPNATLWRHYYVENLFNNWTMSLRFLWSDSKCWWGWRPNQLLPHRNQGL